MRTKMGKNSKALTINRYEQQLHCHGISFRYSKGASHMEGNEIHPYHEILYYMGGNATFVSEKFKEVLTPGTLLLIPKASYHQFIIHNQEAYTRLVLNFSDAGEAESLSASILTGIRILRHPGSRLTKLLEQMCQVVNSSDFPSKPDIRNIFLYGTFLILFAELSREDELISSPQLREKDGIMPECLHYIDRHFISDLSVKEVADQLNVSASTLAHTFKKELGISFYRYIIEKRLVHAHRLISEGHKPTQVYLECGYHDYPTFYKAYLKMFGCSPADKKANPIN